MRGKLKYAVGVLLIGLVVGAFYACSPQKNLARRLKDADRVVITYPSDGFSITITNEEVKRVVQAISVGKKENPLINATPYLQFQFSKGSEHLQRVTTSSQVFWVGNQAFSDKTGTLQDLTARWHEEHLLHTPWRIKGH